MEQDLYKTSFANYPDVASIREYKKIAMEMLQLNFPKLYKDELASAIDISISNHFQNTNARIDNNYKNKNRLDNSDCRISHIPGIVFSDAVTHYVRPE